MRLGALSTFTQPISMRLVTSSRFGSWMLVAATVDGAPLPAPTSKSIEVALIRFGREMFVCSNEEIRPSTKFVSKRSDSSRNPGLQSPKQKLPTTCLAFNVISMLVFAIESPLVHDKSMKNLRSSGNVGGTSMVYNTSSFDPSNAPTSRPSMVSSHWPGTFSSIPSDISSRKK